jgi:hypothetical protein
MINYKELNKLLKKSIGFLIFLFIVLFTIEYVLAWLVANSDTDQTGKINLIMDNKVDPDILILGSSVAEVGFNSNLMAQELNTSVYNSAIDGTTLIQSQFILEEFLSYSSNCKQIIIGLAFFSFGEKTSMTEPSRYIAHFSNSFVKENIKSISSNLFYKLQYVPFYSFTQTKHTYYKNAAFGLKNILNNKKLLPNQLNGFVPHDTPWNGGRIDSVQFGSEKVPLSATTIASYGEIISYIKQQEIEPIIVITPMFINGQKLFSNYDMYIKTVEELANKYQIEWYDFSKSDIVYDESFFYNNGHLNHKGAYLFSTLLSDSLQAK